MRPHSTQPRRIRAYGEELTLQSAVQRWAHPTLHINQIRTRIDRGEPPESALSRPSSGVEGPVLPPPNLSDPVYRLATTEPWV